MFLSPSKFQFAGGATAANVPVAGYMAWYNPTTIQQTANVVTAWKDASVNLFNLTTPANSPAYIANAINGLAGVGFNGTNQKITSGTVLSSVISASAYTIYCVYTFSAYTGGNNTSLNNIGTVFGSADNNFGSGPGSTHVIGGHVDSGGTKIVDAGAITTGITVITEQYYDGTNINFRVNGTNATPTAAGNVNVLTADVGVSLNDIVHGTICEVLVYNTTLSGANMTSNRTYLGTKYAGTG